MHVSVIIVNYNAGSMLTQCVRALLTSSIPVSVRIADNASRDDSLTQLRTALPTTAPVTILPMGDNLGFARANNRALQGVDSPWLLFINPDCVVRPDTLQKVLTALQNHPAAGMAGCVIRNPDGSEQAGCRRHIPTPWSALASMTGLGRSFALHQTPLPTQTTNVEAISGAFMLVRAEALNKVGLLDETYFMHCEDLDWCLRFRQAGYDILFVPDAEASHLKGHSSAGRPVFVEWHKHRGMVVFYRKFFRRRYAWPIMWTVFAGIWLRFGWRATRLTLRRLLNSPGSTP